MCKPEFGKRWSTLHSIWQQRELKNHCKNSSHLREEVVSFRVKVFYEAVETRWSTGRGDKRGMKVDPHTPRSGFCRPLSLTRSNAGITPGGLCNFASASGAALPRLAQVEQKDDQDVTWMPLTVWMRSKANRRFDFKNAKQENEIRCLHSLVIFTFVYYSQRDLCSEDLVGVRQ